MTISVDDFTGQGLVSEELFDQLVHRIVRERAVTAEYATRIVDQALAFLAACARSTEPLSPSSTVDIGWHAFILYTKEYDAFCRRIAGYFLHHDPTPMSVTPNDLQPQENVNRSVQAIREAGFAVDLDLWDVSAKCSQCKQGCTHSGGNTGCHHHPVRPDTVSA
ncbi:glycine-rich domain-containing protein [Amycolatopsis sp. CA-161197]|uniref:glycine-rich domain-containing protein n=1 Tax=Amycolatopsis sp. CA-161197 TaxID=3239922 RepID=UPI003D8EFC97